MSVCGWVVGAVDNGEARSSGCWYPANAISMGAVVGDNGLRERRVFLFAGDTLSSSLFLWLLLGR